MRKKLLVFALFFVFCGCAVMNDKPAIQQLTAQDAPVPAAESVQIEPTPAEIPDYTPQVVTVLEGLDSFLGGYLYPKSLALGDISDFALFWLNDIAMTIADQK